MSSKINEPNPPVYILGIDTLVTCGTRNVSYLVLLDEREEKKRKDKRERGEQESPHPRQCTSLLNDKSSLVKLR